MDGKNSNNMGVDNLICFQKGSEKLFIRKDEIVMFTTNGRKVDIYTVTNKYTINSTLNEIEKKLKDDLFFRSHKSHLVNIKMIKKIVGQNEGRYIVFKSIQENAFISKANERKIYELVNII